MENRKTEKKHKQRAAEYMWAICVQWQNLCRRPQRKNKNPALHHQGIPRRLLARGDHHDPLEHRAPLLSEHLNLEDLLLVGRDAAAAYPGVPGPYRYVGTLCVD